MRGLIAFLLFTGTLLLSSACAQADPFKKAAAAVRNTHRWLWDKKSPHPEREPDIELLAREVDWLEHLIESYGSVMPKHPDVWGDARLTRFRHEYEREIAKRFDSGVFNETLQGAIRRSDQSLLSLALSINAASGGAAPPTSNAAVTLMNDPNAANAIQRTPPLPLDLTHFKAQELSLEPTVLNDQLSRYLEHLNTLRRINEGADEADSAGYAIYLVRVPVSVLPGHHTRKGFGAEITFTLAPYLSDDLLPRTMRNLIINDVSQILSIPLAQLFNNDPDRAQRFLTDYWTQQGRVRRWIQAYDCWLEWLERNRLEEGCNAVEYLPAPRKRERLPAASARKDSESLSTNAEPRDSARAISSRRLRFASNTDSNDSKAHRCISDDDLAFLQSLRWYLQYRLTEIAAQAQRERESLLGQEKWYAGRLPAECENFPSPCETKKVFRWPFDLDEILGEPTPPERLSPPEPLPPPGDGLEAPDALLGDRGAPTNPPNGKAEAAKPGGHNKEREPAARSRIVVLEVSATQFAKFFDALADYVLERCHNAEVDETPKAPLNVDLVYGQGERYERLPFAFPLKLRLPDDYQRDDIVGHRQLPFDIDDKDVLKQLKQRDNEGNDIGPTSGLPIGWLELFVGEMVKQIRQELFRNYSNIISNILNNSLDNSGATTSLFMAAALTSASSGNAGTACTPLAPSQLYPAYGFDGFMDVALDAHWNLRSNVTNLEIVSIADIERYLQTETQVAYELIDQQGLWWFCTPSLSAAIRARDDAMIGKIRNDFMTMVGGPVKHTATATLAWAIIVDAALINDLLIKDMRSVAIAKGCACNEAEHLRFVGPREAISPEAHEAFKQYVLCRWPIIAFSLDPVTQDQNIADVFSRRQELQLAVAVAVAQGNVSPSTALKFSRETETDMETIALNRTSVGFSHDHDTIGWRFYPRFQSPDTPGNLVAFAETLLGPPGVDHDMRNRQLEPAERECTAVVVMPSFVSYMKVTSRANWFGLTNPRKKQLTLHDDMRISRTFQTLRTAQIGGPTAAYRPEDLEMLGKTLDQIERRLPMQEMTVEVPYENTLGGAELFCRGVRALAPRLDGWYGAPGIDPDDVTTLYLVGKRFSIHETRILAGGRYVPYRMLSRNVLEVEIPPGVQVVETGPNRFVDVHAAAPWGVTGNHLLIPLAPESEPPGHFSWVAQTFRANLNYANSNAPSALDLDVLAEPKIEFGFSPPLHPLPPWLWLSLTINEVSKTGELVLESVKVGARLDLQKGRYVIDGDQFNVLRDALLRTANHRFALKKPSPKERVRWLMRGTVCLAGSPPEPIRSSVVLDVIFELKP